MGVAGFATPFYFAPLCLFAVMLRNEVTMADAGTGDDQDFLIPSIGVSELEELFEQLELPVESMGGEGCRGDLLVCDWSGPICREQIGRVPFSKVRI